MRTSFALFVPLSLAIGSCAMDSGPADPSAATYVARENEQLRDRLALCEKRTGYGPGRSAELGSYQLGRGELAWRSCAYAALTEIIVPATVFPELYTGLIEQDRQLTRMIQQRKITRAERAERINQMLARIRETELAETARRDPLLAASTRERFLMQSTPISIRSFDTLR